MGLREASIGRAADSGPEIRSARGGERLVALAGNPNVGKSTLFNRLTGLRQHTGNWPGKTVSCAQGRCRHEGRDYLLVDLPGSYSLLAHSAEEEAARDFVCFGGADAVIAVCDATCLERNLNLALQLMEITPNVIVCINLMDEARRKHIRIDLKMLRERLGVPVVGISARSGRGTQEALAAVDEVISATWDNVGDSSGIWEERGQKEENSSGKLEESGDITPKSAEKPRIRYAEEIEEAIDSVLPHAEKLAAGRLNARWLAIRLIEHDLAFYEAIERQTGVCLEEDKELSGALQAARERLRERGMNEMRVRDELVRTLLRRAEMICRDAVIRTDAQCDAADRRLDRILTGRWLGFPIMFLLMAVIFWITISGANLPSQWLSGLLFRGEEALHSLMAAMGAPGWLDGVLVSGAYRVLAWVVSVMLPPMAIFFPLFTLLEDAGYLPRVAFNMDRCFHKCRACGKQCLTMMMGFGCNAVGITGCRIIDSPRERLIAMLTNVFVPCNGRFPMMVSLISVFLLGGAAGWRGNVLAAAVLAGLIVLGVAMTLMVSYILSRTVLRGMPSSFTLELPPYRKPQIAQVIVRSVLDRTLFVLGRAAAVAAPAGALIWIMANAEIGGASLLSHVAAFLDPLGRLMGMDGVILLGFILGWPANEIVLPVIIMAYAAGGELMELGSLAELGMLLRANGWTWVTAISTMLFSLMHWPCSTALMTMYKESKSLKWTLMGILIPTLTGMAVCIAFSNIAQLVMSVLS
ncbi:MAG: ferrous iron transport protein B [Clostridia bacterium]|nr:ferrous iron transport protein B [Clostridia bacterium]